MAIHIIAECCTNHDGHEDKAKDIMMAAKSSGADSVKFQMIFPEYLYIEKIIQNGNFIQNPVIEQRKTAQLSNNVYRNLALFAKKIDLPFSASIFDTHGLDLLDSLDPPYIKIASCDLNNIPLISKVASSKNIIILSTGMGELHEIEQALNAIEKNGSPHVVLLHCVSIYPATVEQTNLSVIPILKKKFGKEVGFSDHTLGSCAATAALALGATWFEKHFTLNTGDIGFDHAHSTSPADFKEYVRTLRSVDSACQQQVVKVCEDELTLRKRARRGLYAARDLNVGEIINENDILVVRPESYFKPADVTRISGSCLKKSLKCFAPLEEDNF